MITVPLERERNFQFRKWLAHTANKDKGFRRQVIDWCRQDILFYVNSFVYQFNPTKKRADAAGPFICYPYQADALVGTPETTGTRGLIWCYENNKSAVLQKSRKMGATWLFLILEDWLCLFQENVQALNISRNADAVDCKSPDSLFWKIRFMHRHLPMWLKGEIIEQEMYFGFADRNSTITGEASTGRAGVGGRASVIFIDEVSKIREAREVRQRTANTADCRFFNSTHEGIDTEFYQLTKTPDMVQMTWHWTDHPDYRKGRYWYSPKLQKIEHIDKDYSFPPDYPYVTDGSPLGGPHPGVRSPWYDRMWHEIGSKLGVAVELDINPEGSVDQVFDALLIRSLLVECYGPTFQGDLEYDPDTARLQRLVERKTGPLRLWCKLDPNGRPPLSRYFIGADVSSGQGATPTCITVIDGETGCKVAMYVSSRCDPIQAGFVMVCLAWFFKDKDERGARLIWELIGPGFKSGEVIVDQLRYGNVYMRTDEMRLDKKQTLTPGWVPSKPNKYRLIMDYAEALRLRTFLNVDEESLRETAQFRWQAGEPVHDLEDTDSDVDARSSHADRVIADALAWKITALSGMGRLEKKKESKTGEPPFLSRNWREWYAKRYGDWQYSSSERWVSDHGLV